MKIAFVNHDFIIGDGTGTVFWNLARRLAKDHEVTIFTFNSNYNDSYGVRIAEIPIPFRKNKFVNPGMVPLFQNKCIELRNRLKSYDVIYSQLYPANFIPLFPSKIKGPLQLYTEWTTQRTPGFPLYTKIFGNYIDWVDSYVVRHVDRVIAPSIYAERWLKDKFGIQASLLYLDGIDFATLDKNAATTKDIYGKYPSLEGARMVLFVGVLSPHKNLEMLIRSVAIARKEITNVRLVIVGRTSRYPNYYQALVKLARQEEISDAVIFTGAASWEDLGALYAACDVFATCSVWEGFLRAEAFAMEKPMVAFDATSNAETIKHGETGLLVKERTPQAFAAALVALLHDEKRRKEMGKNGYQWAKENLDFDVIARNFIRFIEESS
jgi:1,2-diacylglycerol 3-alpha-glucosyltransferase